MTGTHTTRDSSNLEARVRRLVGSRAAEVSRRLGSRIGVSALLPGKMLRTRFAALLASGCSVPPGAAMLERACAATEMVHTATLCHDDVIDGGILRRSLPTLWRSAGTVGAVLIGDVLLCEGIRFVLEDGGGLVERFVSKVTEVCRAEAEQELVLRGSSPDVETCMSIARRKTGPLFAFLGGVCGGDDEALSGALEEAGYRVGTAYQLADDLIDVAGSEEVSGKTLGTDEMRSKFTLPQAGEVGRRAACGMVAERFDAARHCLDDWPAVRAGLDRFLDSELRPVFEGLTGLIDLPMGVQA